MNNLIYCLRHNCLINNQAKPTFSGLGDIIRGISQAYMICKYNDINFFICASGHSLEPFININEELVYHGNFPEHIPYIDGNNHQLQEFLTLNSSNDSVFVMSNGDLELDSFSPPEPLINFLKQIFLENFSIQNALSNKKSKIQKSLHFRLGDQSLVSSNFLLNYYRNHMPPSFSFENWSNSLNDDYVFDFLLNSFESKIKEVDFVSCDNIFFLNFIKNKFPHILFNENKCHTGLTNQEESLTDTLSDFYCLSYSRDITSVSHFPFAKRKSAFSTWAGFLGNADSVNYFSFDPQNLECLKL